MNAVGLTIEAYPKIADRTAFKLVVVFVLVFYLEDSTGCIMYILIAGNDV